MLTKIINRCLMDSLHYDRYMIEKVFSKRRVSQVNAFYPSRAQRNVHRVTLWPNSGKRMVNTLLTVTTLGC